MVDHEAYERAQQAWAAIALGTINDERIKRHGVALCLADARRRGLIN